MRELPSSSKYLQEPDQLVDETEREALSKRLSDAYADGRLGQDDYLAQLDVVYRAQTNRDLVPVVRNLPAPSQHTPRGAEVEAKLPAGEVNISKRVPILPVALVGVTALALVAVIAVLLGMLL